MKETTFLIYYRILSGSIKDVSALRESLGSLELPDTPQLHLVMDKGFFSKLNIDALYHERYQFSIEALQIYRQKDTVEKNVDDLKSECLLRKNVKSL